MAVFFLSRIILLNSRIRDRNFKKREDLKPGFWSRFYRFLSLFWEKCGFDRFFDEQTENIVSERLKKIACGAQIKIHQHFLYKMLSKKSRRRRENFGGKKNGRICKNLKINTAVITVLHRSLMEIENRDLNFHRTVLGAYWELGAGIVTKMTAKSCTFSSFA